MCRLWTMEEDGRNVKIAFAKVGLLYLDFGLLFFAG